MLLGANTILQIRLNKYGIRRIVKMSNVKNEREQLIQRTLNNYETALTEYNLAIDAIKCWSPETDIMTYTHVQRCHTSLFQGIECALKTFCEDRNISLVNHQKPDTLPSLVYICNRILVSDELDSVDLCCFVTCKGPRNQGEHESRIVELKGYQRILKNFYRLLNICFPNNSCSIPIELTESTFDFGSFYRDMGEFREEFCRYVLVCDPLHDVTEMQIQTLLRIPWYIILDFDGRSHKRGLKWAIDKSNLDVIPYNLSTIRTAGISESVCQYGKTLYIACEKNKVVPLEEKYWESEKRSNINYFIDQTYSKRHPKIKLVCIKPYAPDLRFVISAFRDVYRIENLEVLFLTDEIGDRKSIEESCENLKIYNSEATEICKVLTQYLHLLPDTEKPKHNDGIWFPSREAEPQLLNDKILIENTEMYFEILHLECGQGIEECNQESFLKGKTASWEVLKQNYDVKLVQNKKYDSFLKSIQDSFVLRPDVNRIFNIIHKPGYGGTTLGRRIAWDLHKKFPVLVLKKYDSVTTSNRLINFYDAVRIGILVLADENSISQSDFEKLEKDIQRINRPIVALCVRRGDTKKFDSNHNLPLDIIDGYAIEAIKQKCSAVVLQSKKRDIIEKRIEKMHTVLTGDMLCPLLISLYLLEEDFTKLDAYVSKFLEKIPDDSDGELLKQALRFVVLCNYFSPKMLPAAMVKMITIGNTNTRISLEQILEPVKELLLYQDKKTYIGTRHYLIAEEIMRQLFVPRAVEASKDMWKDYINKYTREFIDYLYNQCSKKVDSEIIGIITSLFLDKSQSFQIRDENSDTKFSRIIEAIPNVGTERISILRYLADTFNDFIVNNIDPKDGYEEYAMLSRIWANCGRYYSKSNLKDYDKADECCRSALDVMDKISALDYDVYHMSGLCAYERAKEQFIKFTSASELESVKNHIDSAIEFFNKTTIYGSPDYGIPSLIRLVCEFSNKVFHLYDVESLKDISKIKEKWIRKYITDAFDAINDAEDIEFSDKGGTFYKQQRDDFEQLCFKKGVSDVLDVHNSYLNVLLRDHKDTESIVITRKYIIQTLLKRHKGDIYELSKNDKDATRVFELLNGNIELRNKDSLKAYRQWFKLAKCCNKSLNEGLLKATQWKALLNEKGQTEPQPYYYLYVLSLLSYCEGTTGLKDVERYYNDCKNVYAKDKNILPTKIRDWYATGTGMGKLLDTSLVRFSDIQNNTMIEVVQGRVSELDPSGREVYGFLAIDNPPKLNHFEEISKVFFTPSVCGITGLQNGMKVAFKFGFSYERLVAYDKSVDKIDSHVKGLLDSSKEYFDKKLTIMKESPDILENKTVDFTISAFIEKSRLLIGTLNYRKGAIPHWEVSDKSTSNEEMKKLVGQTVRVKVIKYNSNQNNYSLSIKRV